MGSDFSSEELRAAVRAAQVGVWAFDLETGATRFSAEALELFGVSLESMPATLDAFVATLHPDDREPTRSTVRDAIQTRAELFEIEYRIVRPSGEVAWMASRGRCHLGAGGVPVRLSGSVRETTARKRAEIELERREADLKLISELASDYVYDSAVSGENQPPKIVAGSLERTTGYTVDEIGGLGGWLAVIHPEDLPDLMDQNGPVMSGRPFVVEYRIRTKDGSERWLRDRGIPVVNPTTGARERIVGAVQDVTELRHLEAQLLQARKMEALASMAGNVAHDFNNVLMIMTGSLEGLEDALERRADTTSLLEEMHGAIARASELTRSLLAFGRNDGGLARVVDLRAELEDTRPILQRALGKSLALSISVAAGEAAPKVLVDPGQLRLALINLAVNARDATQGQGTLRLELSVVRLTRNAPDRPPELGAGIFARIDVSDSGTGISAEDLPHVFEPYYTTKPVGSGTGLGLAIVYGVLNKHHGAITVQTRVGEGTTFSLYFPITNKPRAASARPPLRVQLGGHERVLVVEGDEGVRRSLERSLTVHGYQVTALQDAPRTRELPDESLKSHPVLVVDVLLGREDGVTLAMELRTRHPELRVLFVAGTAHEGAESSGFRIVRKPFTPTGIAAAVREVLEGELIRGA